MSKDEYVFVYLCLCTYRSLQGSTQTQQCTPLDSVLILSKQFTEENKICSGKAAKEILDLCMVPLQLLQTTLEQASLCPHGYHSGPDAELRDS